MNKSEAGYYDGKVSTRSQVSLISDNHTLTIVGDGIHQIYKLDEVRVSDKIGSARRNILLPDGGLCDPASQALANDLERPQKRGHANNITHKLEINLHYALAALLLTALLVFAFIRFGVPPLSKYVAFAIPPSTENMLGKHTLETLDTLVYKPSKLNQERRKQLTARFKQVSAAIPGTEQCRLEFRSGESVGANAMALPSGIVVVTDDLVALSKNDDELAGVMAHELGHVLHRHILRHSLQSSITGLLIATLTGDITSATSISASLPTALVNASYSRDFEREADDMAISYMKKSAIPVSRYADILARLQSQLDGKKGSKNKDELPFKNYLSTHPETTERIKRVQESH